MCSREASINVCSHKSQNGASRRTSFTFLTISETKMCKVCPLKTNEMTTLFFNFKIINSRLAEAKFDIISARSMFKQSKCVIRLKQCLSKCNNQ